MKLEENDVTHYEKIVFAIRECQKIMKEIDNFVKTFV